MPAEETQPKPSEAKDRMKAMRERKKLLTPIQRVSGTSGKEAYAEEEDVLVQEIRDLHAAMQAKAEALNARMRMRHMAMLSVPGLPPERRDLLKRMLAVLEGKNAKWETRPF